MTDFIWIVAALTLLLAVILSGWVGLRMGAREGHLEGYSDGFADGYAQSQEEHRLAKQRLLFDAGRQTDERLDSTGTARVSDVRITHRNG